MPTHITHNDAVVTLPDGTTYKANNLCRLSDLQKLTGYSRQAIMGWTNGEGRGRDNPLKLIAIGTEATGMIDLDEFNQWLADTEPQSSLARERTARRNKQRLSRSAMDAYRSGEADSMTAAVKEDIDSTGAAILYGDEDKKLMDEFKMFQQFKKMMSQ